MLFEKAIFDQKVNSLHKRKYSIITINKYNQIWISLWKYLSIFFSLKKRAKYASMSKGNIYLFFPIEFPSPLAMRNCLLGEKETQPWDSGPVNKARTRIHNHSRSCHRKLKPCWDWQTFKYVIDINLILLLYEILNIFWDSK